MLGSRAPPKPAGGDWRRLVAPPRRNVRCPSRSMRLEPLQARGGSGGGADLHGAQHAFAGADEHLCGVGQLARGQRVLGT